jgi:hypothetical protein
MRPLATTSAPASRRAGNRPQVRVHQDGGRATRFDHGSRLRDVDAVEEAGGGAVEDGDVELPVPVDVGELQHRHRSVLLLPEDNQVEDAHEAPSTRSSNRRRGPPVLWVSGNSTTR